MKSTAIDVKRPTAESIRRFLALTGKRHLILTGDRRCGKTTLHRELLSLITDTEVPGITTWAATKEAVFMRDNISGMQAAVGVYDADLPGTENKMRLVVKGLTELGIPALERCRNSDSQWVSIDEIGYLECECREYTDTIINLMEQKRLIAVVRKQKLPFLEALMCRQDVCLVDLDQPFGELGCVIMASGFGRRFGSNKLLTDFGGKELICWILDATEGIFSHRVVVTRYREIEKLCRERDIPVVYHELPFRSDTIRLGLEALGDEVSGCLFCPADQPLISQETLQTFALAAVHAPDIIWQLSDGDTIGSPVLFPKWAFPELLCLPEGKGGNVVIKKHAKQVRRLPALHAYELSDIDSPEQLQELKPFL